MQLRKQSVVQACGTKYHNREEFLDETDVDDVVIALVNLARNVSSTICLNMFLLYLVFVFFRYPLTDVVKPLVYASMLLIVLA